jgi:hypothetical protein
MIDPELLAFLEDQNQYSDIREVPERGICAIEKMLGTWGLHYGLTKEGHLGRYCFETYTAALTALKEWDGVGDPGKEWLKQKGGIKGDYSNPLKFPDLFITQRYKIVAEDDSTNRVDHMIRSMEVKSSLDVFNYIFLPSPDPAFLDLRICMSLKHEATMQKALSDAGLLYVENPTI